MTTPKATEWLARYRERERHPGEYREELLNVREIEDPPQPHPAPVVGTVTNGLAIRFFVDIDPSQSDEDHQRAALHAARSLFHEHFPDAKIKGAPE